MEFDVKNGLLKTTVGNSQLGNKNLKASIDESLVSSTAQKNLNMEKEKQSSSKMFKAIDKKKEKKNNSQTGLAFDEERRIKEEKEKQIVRDPLVLLKLL